MKQSMKICKLVALFLSVVAVTAQAQLIPNLGGQRTGISAFQFLKIGVGARGEALGESFVAVANDASALYWNPAGLTQFSDNQITFSHTEYVVDLKHEFAGIAYHLAPNDAVGFSITSLHTSPMEVTTETQPRGTGTYFKYGDLALGLSYSKRMTDQFSFGVTVKYVEETLDILKMRGVMADLGTYYWTGLGSARFAIVISNFGSDVSPSGSVTEYGGGVINDFQSFSPPTQFKLGFAIEPFEQAGQRVTTSIELNHPNDNAENVRLGIEYQWEEWLRLRAGVKRTIGQPFFGSDESSSSNYSLGIGVVAPFSLTKLSFDYAYADFSVLGSVHRLSLALTY